MSRKDILMTAYEKIMKAYVANIDSDGCPENDDVSGNLAEAMSLLDEVV